MTTVELVILLIPIAALVQLLASSIKVPSPTLLVLGGLALALIPGLPPLHLDPNVIFLTFIPPLLYFGAINAPWRQFRLGAWPILSLSVFLVLVTMTVVAVTVHTLSPVFTWAAAFTLGAIVSPPDPVAAIAVTRSLNVSPTIEGILQGEGLANDATALVAYSVAVAAAVTGTFSVGDAALRLVYATAVGVGVGFAMGYAVCWMFTTVARTPLTQNALSLVVPYAAYITADRLGASGVLAVVAAGLVLSRRSARTFSAEVRIQFESLSTLINFMLESLIFIFIGLQLPVVVQGLHDRPLWMLIGIAAAIAAVCIAIRLMWVFPSATFTRRAELRVPGQAAGVWRSVAFVGWAGMRGADSLVIALALPTMTQSGAPFPARASIIVITFGVILATLVLQGFTMGPVARLLKLSGGATRQVEIEESEAWIATADVGLAGLKQIADAPICQTPASRRIIHHLTIQYRKRRREWLIRCRRATGEPSETIQMQRRIGLSIIAREREALLRLRDSGQIDDAISRHVERYLDLETVLFNYVSLDVSDSPFEVIE
jgi:CPA1 family monovalent cation:H+ antiporter